MDIDLENRVKESINQLKQLSIEDIDLNEMDPVAKMLLVAMLNEVQKIQDQVDNMGQRLVERYCSDFIPYDKVNAVPSIAILSPSFKSKKDSEIINIGSETTFSYKTKGNKHPLNYIPIFSINALPYSELFLLTQRRLSFGGNKYDGIKMHQPNQMWLGIVSSVEVQSLKGLSILIKGTKGISPKQIHVGDNHTELDFVTMSEMEKVEMVEPFDAQQSSGQFFSFIESWKDRLLNMEDATLIYITDETSDRDLFKPRTFPSSFRLQLEDTYLNLFEPNTLWLRIDFPEGYTVPDDCQLTINSIPVVNVDVNTLTLTQASPIAKLQKQEDSFFLNVVETSSASIHQGFNSTQQDIIIRDFDASCYHNGDLYREVRNLYNRFIDDYYAFIEYNGIKDGESLKQLRQTINQIGKSVGDRGNSKYKFDSGSYVMKNMNNEQESSTVKVTFLTTQGRAGNAPRAGEIMEVKKLPSIEQKVDIIVSAMGGCDKASADERYELLRYYSLTNDRLFTRMDIDAFLRKEIISEFGKDEFNRIFIKMAIEGIGGNDYLQRGLYIDIEFKDKKNYDRAISMALDKQMQQKIDNKSCISMPVIIKLINLEEDENAHN
ncbi:MAG: hypothetical protein IJV11_02965 [Muribaculaceae bacterium]|nr:hypothetical protein [Muribaculaceae bacterium]